MESNEKLAVNFLFQNEHSSARTFLFYVMFVTYTFTAISLINLLQPN